MSNNDPRLRATTLGIELAAHAAKAGIQQIEVAQKTGYSPVTINRIFNGKFPAKSEILCAIAEAIGCDLLAVKQQLTALKAHLEVALSATTKFSLTKAAEIQYEISRLEEIYAVMVKLNTELFTV